jgi:hypothetical protein
MSGSAAQYRCQACGAISRKSALAASDWGDPCCPACKSPDLVRHRTKGDTIYAMFFTFRVF